MLFIDIGNSYAKVLYMGQVECIPIDQLNFDQFFLKHEVIWVSNVNHSINLPKLDKLKEAVVAKKYKSLINGYQDFTELGVDRWLSLIATYEKFPNNSCLVMDIGSAVTIDFLDKKGVHIGGQIAPGLNKLNETFDKFSSLYIETDTPILVDSTAMAWSCGIKNMIISYINSSIEEIKKSYQFDRLIFTGGGYKTIKKYISHHHIYEEHLVLDGLQLNAKYMG